MKIKNKVLTLINHGLSGELLSQLNEGQINTLHSKLVESKKENKEEIKTQTTSYTFNPADSTDQQKLAQKGIHVDPTTKKITLTTTPSGTITEVDDEEMNEDSSGDLDLALALQSKEMSEKKDLEEKFESKAQQKYFWAKCNRSKGKEKEKWCSMAKEFSEKTTKKDYKKMPEKIHPEKTVKVKKEQKEGYLNMVGKAMNKNMENKIADIRPGIKWESEIEKKIGSLIERHLSPKMTKGELVKLVSETKTAPTIAPPKPKTPKHDPDNPYKVKPGVKPAPKAETKEQAPTIAPPKPKTPTKPSPSTPYRPKPGPKPAPKAGSEKMPSWMSFSEIGIKLK